MDGHSISRVSYPPNPHVSHLCCITAARPKLLVDKIAALTHLCAQTQTELDALKRHSCRTCCFCSVQEPLTEVTHWGDLVNVMFFTLGNDSPRQRNHKTMEQHNISRTSYLPKPHVTHRWCITSARSNLLVERFAAPTQLTHLCARTQTELDALKRHACRTYCFRSVQEPLAEVTHWGDLVNAMFFHARIWLSQPAKPQNYGTINATCQNLMYQIAAVSHLPDQISWLTDLQHQLSWRISVREPKPNLTQWSDTLVGHTASVPCKNPWLKWHTEATLWALCFSR